jgi:hypothetical protein
VTAEHDPDTIDGYLEGPVISDENLKQAGGVLKYWEQALPSRPRVARMALDFLSAPGNISSFSVDVLHLKW